MSGRWGSGVYRVARAPDILPMVKNRLRDIATAHGCAGFGVTDADEFSGVAATLRSRVEAGLAGRKRFTYKNPEMAADVRVSFPWAASIIVVSWSYLQRAGSPREAAPGTGRIARFATEDHYAGLRAATAAMRTELLERGHRAEVLVDDDRLVDRAAAVRAGVAWWGKNTMALDPRHGPWLLLGSVVTDAKIGPNAPMRRDCGTCDACIPACPTGAIIAPGVLDASRCLAHWAQTAGSFPLDLREVMGDRIYGCDDCLEACPPGRKLLPGAQTGPGRVDLIELLASDDADLLDRYAHFYIPRRRPRILRRNAIIAFGNVYTGTGNRGTLDVLGSYLNDDDPQLRAHVAWAIGRVGGDTAKALLEAQFGIEWVLEVREEIKQALSGLR